MKKTLLFFSLIIVGISFLYVTNSCRKELIPPDGVNEPITFWNPDTNWIKIEGGRYYHNCCQTYN